jgi:DNA-binding transcriptional MerR regulator
MDYITRATCPQACRAGSGVRLGKIQTYRENGKMYLIRQLAAKYHLTRTALLHYDAIGLLSPSKRTEAGYRLYGEEDEIRLQDILLFRSMGISLVDIKQLLEGDKSKLANVLLIRLDELNREIEELKARQMNIINLLKDVKKVEEFFFQENLERTAQIIFAGIDPLAWHEQFESISPELHKEFLEILDSIPDDIKESIQGSLESLPEEERMRLDKLIHKK